MGGPALAIRMVLRRTGRHPRLAAAFAYSTPSHDRTVEAGWRPSLLECFGLASEPGGSRLS